MFDCAASVTVPAVVAVSALPVTFPTKAPVTVLVETSTISVLPSLAYMSLLNVLGNPMVKLFPLALVVISLLVPAISRVSLFAI